ncbi:DUF4352 domain-containing protein [Mycolicibacterium sp. NCC-Tsukiji]|uniref:DUF4352 domain-containing protein n=1 Tax=Mycolicibacterium sp. NCC-Tsukiji TaxID=2185272 RepID=UPI000ED3C7C8|nr:DUF4352 domain-containing protein [Mycolicibacterium sp. NCC-Tsukiji]GCB00965.1 Mpr protein [Mycolicibacterium sp. NCC-Tsukiji]
MTTPYPQQAPVGQYPPAAKKRRKWPWIIGGFVAFLLAVSALSDNGKDGPSRAVTSSQSQSAKPSTATLNTPVRDGKFEFVVKAVQPGLAEVGDNPYLERKAQGQFVVVTLSVQNIGDKPQSFSPSNQKLIDNQGRSFESDAAAQVALGGSDIPVWDNINPGNAVDVKLVYDMPQGAVPTNIELHDSMFSGGATVSLKP